MSRRLSVNDKRDASTGMKEPLTESGSLKKTPQLRGDSFDTEWNSQRLRPLRAETGTKLQSEVCLRAPAHPDDEHEPETQAMGRDARSRPAGLHPPRESRSKWALINAFIIHQGP
jgi:hypothetical protein